MVAPCYITKLIRNISQQKCCINSFTDSECSAIPSEAASMPQTGRRNALKLLSGSFALASFPWAESRVAAGAVGEQDGRRRHLALLFDGTLRTPSALPRQTAHSLSVERGPAAQGPRGRRVHLRQSYARRPQGPAPRRRPPARHHRQVQGRRREARGSHFLRATARPRRHAGPLPEPWAGFPRGRPAGAMRAHELAEAPGGFWSFSGATHEDRRDWVQPLQGGFRPAQLAQHGRVRLRRRHPDGQHLASRRGPGRGPPGADPSPARPAGAQDARRARASPSKARRNSSSSPARHSPPNALSWSLTPATISRR